MQSDAPLYSDLREVRGFLDRVWGNRGVSAAKLPPLPQDILLPLFFFRFSLPPGHSFTQQGPSEGRGKEGNSESLLWPRMFQSHRGDIPALDPVPTRGSPLLSGRGGLLASSHGSLAATLASQGRNRGSHCTDE